MTHHVTQSPSFTAGFTVGVVDSAGLDNCVMTCIHHYSVLCSSFTPLKIFCSPPIHLSLPQLLMTTDLFFFFHCLYSFPSMRLLSYSYWARPWGWDSVPTPTNLHLPQGHGDGWASLLDLKRCCVTVLSLDLLLGRCLLNSYLCSFLWNVAFYSGYF